MARSSVNAVEVHRGGQRGTFTPGLGRAQIAIFEGRHCINVCIWCHMAEIIQTVGFSQLTGNYDVPLSWKNVITMFLVWVRNFYNVSHVTCLFSWIKNVRFIQNFSNET